MKVIIYKKHVLINATVILIIMGFLILPGFSLAAIPDISSSGTPHKPAYVENKEDLVNVQVVHRPGPPHPMLPETTDVDIIELLEQLDEQRILKYLENLTDIGPRKSGTAACDQAAHYLYGAFQDLGLQVRYHNYTDTVVSGSNVEAILNGTDTTNIFIICAHYDTVSAGPGADDDGSGVAAVLAAAEIMRNYTFSHTVRFVCFSGEEQGLIGSRHYVEDAYNSNEPIIAVLNADMIGFAPSSSDGTKGKIFENAASEWIVNFTKDISQLYADYIGIQLFPQGESWGSDHYYFWEYGYDAVFYHEYNFNDYYHTANDTIEHMNISYTTRFSRLILATLAEMAQQPRPVLEITDISGGFGIKTKISNIGDDNANNVNITLVITGGLIGLIHKTFTDETATLAPEDSFQFSARLIRIGNIDINVRATAANANQVTKHATAFLLGPFVLKVVNNP